MSYSSAILKALLMYPFNQHFSSSEQVLLHAVLDMSTSIKVAYSQTGQLPQLEP